MKNPEIIYKGASLPLILDVGPDYRFQQKHDFKEFGNADDKKCIELCVELVRCILDPESEFEEVLDNIQVGSFELQRVVGEVLRNRLLNAGISEEEIESLSKDPEEPPTQEAPKPESAEEPLELTNKLQETPAYMPHPVGS